MSKNKNGNLSRTSALQRISGELTEFLGTGKHGIITGVLNGFAGMLFNALQAAFAGDESGIILFVTLGCIRQKALRRIIRQYEPEIPGPQIQMTTPEILEQLMNADRCQFDAMAANCRLFIVCLEPSDFEDLAWESWIGTWHRIHSSAGVLYRGFPGLELSRIQAVHPELRRFDCAVEMTGLIPTVHFFDEDADPNHMLSPEFQKICRRRKSLVVCRCESQRLRYSEASHNVHVPVFSAEKDEEPDGEHYQVAVSDAMSEFSLEPPAFRHFVAVDPAPEYDVSRISDLYLSPGDPVSVLVTDRFSLLSAIASITRFSQDSSAEDADKPDCCDSDALNDAWNEAKSAFELFSRLHDGECRMPSVMSPLDAMILGVWEEQGLISGNSGRYELTASGKRLFPGIRNLAQLGILWSWRHETPCESLNHEFMGYIRSDFLRLNTSGRFCIGSRVYQKHFHNLPGNEASLRINMTPGYPAWPDSMPIVCYKEHMHGIRDILLRQDYSVPESVRLDEKCIQMLEELRSRFSDFPADHFIEVTHDAAQWWTFAGAEVNQLIAQAIQSIAPKLRLSCGNFFIRLSWAGSAPCSTSQIVSRIQAIASQVVLLSRMDNSDELRRILWPSWKQAHFLGWLFPILPESIQNGLFNADVRRWCQCIPDEIPVAEVEMLHGIDENIPVQFEELPTVQPAKNTAVHIAQAPVHSKNEEPKVIQIERGDGSMMHTRYPWTYVDDEQKLARAINIILAQQFIGLDVETTLYDQRLCLIQIGCADQSFLIDPLSVDISGLAQVFSHPGIVKVIHNSTFECGVLGKLGFQINNIVDTLRVSRKKYGMKYPGGHSLKAVCLREFGYEMDKENQTSRWEKRPLSASQLEYAALDAEILIHLYRHFYKAICGLYPRNVG